MCVCVCVCVCVFVFFVAWSGRSVFGMRLQLRRYHLGKREWHSYGTPTVANIVHYDFWMICNQVQNLQRTFSQRTFSAGAWISQALSDKGDDDFCWSGGMVGFQGFELCCWASELTQRWLCTGGAKVDGGTAVQPKGSQICSGSSYVEP